MLHIKRTGGEKKKPQSPQTITVTHKHRVQINHNSFSPKSLHFEKCLLGRLVCFGKFRNEVKERSWELTKQMVLLKCSDMEACAGSATGTVIP